VFSIRIKISGTGWFFLQAYKQRHRLQFSTHIAPAVGYFNYVQQKARVLNTKFTVQPTKKLSITGNYTFVSVQEEHAEPYQF
jgi:hypothetical protein